MYVIVHVFPAMLPPIYWQRKPVEGFSHRDLVCMSSEHIAFNQFCCSGLNTLCWFGVVVSLFALNPLELVGVQEPLTRLLGW